MTYVRDDDARLYDAAMGWDSSAEAAWLEQRLAGTGGTPRRVLEPGCGSGRMLEALARRGIEVAGIDASPAMLARARARFAAAGLPAPRLALGDMARFDLGIACDGAVCPINTFSHLPSEADAGSHLESVASHLPAGARYLVQLDLYDLETHQAQGTPNAHSTWETKTPDGTVRAAWYGRRYDPTTRIEMQVARFEVIDGPRAGAVSEGEHPMLLWGWSRWSKLVDRSPFQQVAAYAGDVSGAVWPPLELGTSLDGRALTWHELAV